MLLRMYFQNQTENENKNKNPHLDIQQEWKKKNLKPSERKQRLPKK